MRLRTARTRSSAEVSGRQERRRTGETGARQSGQQEVDQYKVRLLVRRPCHISMYRAICAVLCVLHVDSIDATPI